MINQLRTTAEEVATRAAWPQSPPDGSMRHLATVAIVDTGGSAAVVSAPAWGVVIVRVAVGWRALLPWVRLRLERHLRAKLRRCVPAGVVPMAYVVRRLGQ